MKRKNDLFSYIYDFLSMIFEYKDLNNEIENIFLYGSVAKGTSDDKSDIDLFFDIRDESNKGKITDNLKLVLKSFEVKADKTWGLKNIGLPINLIVGSLESEMWKGLKDEIISSGIVLYGDYREMPEGTNHSFLFYYSLQNLDRKNKMKFIRNFFGYGLKKGKKEYKQEGLLEKINGLKLGSNVVLVSSKDILKVKKIFSKFKIRYKIKEVWIRE